MVCRGAALKLSRTSVWCTHTAGFAAVAAVTGTVLLPRPPAAAAASVEPATGTSAQVVVTEDPSYLEGIKIYGIGIKEDPVPGEKRGKGMQRLNSSYWMLRLATFIERNFAAIQAMTRYAYARSEEESQADFDASKADFDSGSKAAFDFRYFINCSNALFIKAENEGLQTADAMDYFLMACWCAMAAAEVDGYRSNAYAKYSVEQRREMREAFYRKYGADQLRGKEEPLWRRDDSDEADKDDAGMEVALGKYAIDACRIDLIPSVALERLGLHQELCALKWKDPSNWQRNGFVISARIDSLKRHFECVHARDYTEDHIAHLIWGFMAIYHVATLFPEKNDLPNFEALRQRD